MTNRDEQCGLPPNAWIGDKGTVVTGELYLDHRFPGKQGERFAAGRVCEACRHELPCPGRMSECSRTPQEALLFELQGGPATIGWLIHRPAVKQQFGFGYYERGRKIHRQIYGVLLSMEKRGLVQRVPNDLSREVVWKALA